MLLRLTCACLVAGSFCFGADVTYTHDVAPILFEHCTKCHHPDDVAPMSLLSYRETRPWAKSIRAAVIQRKMPPWHADPHYGDFSNDARLTDAQIETIKTWVDAGAPEGDRKDMPAAPRYAEGWRLGPPDAIVQIPEDYVVKAGAEDQYVFMNVPTHFDHDVWVQALELRPGNRRVVHHAHVYLHEPAKGELGVIIRKPSEDDKDPNNGPGFTFRQAGLEHARPNAPVADDGCAGPNGGLWPGEKEDEMSSMLSSFLPGKDPDRFPDGYARKIPAGSTIQFQIHYHALPNEDQTDRTSVGIYFSKEPPRQALRRIDIHNQMFRIPAGDPNHRVTACYTFPKAVELMSYTAHMHLRGKDMRFDAVHPDGRRETLFSVPRYDFNWQTEYKLRKPVYLEKGTRMEITAHFDNSANNPANPDPTKVIRWGEPSYEEMMDGWFEFILPEKDAGVNVAASAPLAAE